MYLPPMQDRILFAISTPDLAGSWRQRLGGVSCFGIHNQRSKRTHCDGLHGFRLRGRTGSQTAVR